MSAGGLRPRSGRPRGARNKRTRERQEIIAKVGAMIEHSFPGDAHAFMVRVYKDEEIELHARLEAAKSAAPYEKPRLSTVAHTGKGGGPIETRERQTVVVLPSNGRDDNDGD